MITEQFAESGKTKHGLNKVMCYHTKIDLIKILILFYTNPDTKHSIWEGTIRFALYYKNIVMQIIQKLRWVLIGYFQNQRDSLSGFNSPVYT